MIEKPSAKELEWAIQAAEGGQFYSSVTLNKYRQWADEQIEKLRDVCKRRDGQLADAAQQLEQAESQRDDAVAERDRARKVTEALLAENRAKAAKIRTLEKLDPARVEITESDPDMKTEVLTSACRDFASLSQLTQRALIDWATGSSPEKK